MDFYSDDSDPDIDEDLQRDLDALRQSCILSGNDPDAAVAQVSASLAAGTSGAGGGEEWLCPMMTRRRRTMALALVRSIRENLLNKASCPPHPICVWPPSDLEEDDDNDLETLRAIQHPLLALPFR